MTKYTLAVCLVAVIITGLLIIPGQYAQFKSASDFVLFGIGVGPYILLALLAWAVRKQSGASRVVLGAAILLASVGLAILATETRHYRGEVRAFAERDPQRGGQYIVERYQRMALFAVPVCQWVAAVTLGSALGVQRLLVARRP